MNKVMVRSLCVALLMVANISFGQLKFAMNLTFDYPTVGFNDGKIIPQLVGNYPNPVEYIISLQGISAEYTVSDSLINLSSAAFGDVIYISTVDIITGDTITGAAAFPYVSQDISLVWDSFNGPADEFNCDGNFTGTVNDVFSGPIMVQWYEDYTLTGTAVSMPDITALEMTNICPGNYTLNIPLSSVPVMITHVYVEPLNATSGSFDVEVFTTPSSADSCTSDANATVIGGVAPYQFFWDLQLGTDQEDSLCPGLHSLKVIDANSDSCMVLFGVADSANFWDDTDFFTSVDDTIYFMTEDCGIDYSQPIDSVAITFVDFYTDSTVAMGFTIWQGSNTFYVQDTSSYGPPVYGAFLIDLTQFCLNKDLGGELFKFRTIYTKLLAVDENESARFTVYPNPAENVVYVKGENLAQIRISDFTGKLVLQTTNNSVDVSGIPSGIYLITAEDQNHNWLETQKIIISH
jgi:hypothetical protein